MISTSGQQHLAAQQRAVGGAHDEDVVGLFHKKSSWFSAGLDAYRPAWLSVAIY
jgi:hypothetical protein